MLLLLSFVLLSCIFNGIMNNDEGMWSYIGRIWVENNMPPYIGAVENKTPGIFVLFAVSHILFGTNYMFARLLGVTAILLSSFTIYLIGKKLHTPQAGIFSMTIFGLTMSWHLLDGAAAAHTETFMVLFSTSSFYLIIQGKGSRNWKYWVFFAGLSMGLALAFKQIAITTTLALGIFFLVYDDSIQTARERMIGLFIVALGMVIATFFTLVPLLVSGVSLKEYVDGAWLILLNPGSSAEFARHAEGFLNTWLNTRIVVFYPFFLLLIFERDLLRERCFMGLLAWMFCDFVGVNLSGHSYGHQIKQIMPSASLIFGIILGNTVTRRFSESSVTARQALALLMILVVLLLPYKQWAVNLYKKMTGYTDIKMSLASFLEKNTGKNDYIYIAGHDGNPALSCSGRISSSKYFNTIFVTGDTEKKQLMSDLKARPPLYFLSPPLIMPELEIHTADQYELLPMKTEYAGFYVFKRK